uniref:Uncharacterized protein n=1 Tax=Pycnococcus provasolii TaxID=41880 RepID=A0A7S2AWF8_9CHLO|mmetsp:Transcript_3473/g.7644  ORF Transcript_3473/g.7644 Transcript_3473/m.7644 type:complete len:270 (+) Transcript_3473:74-883(+)
MAPTLRHVPLVRRNTSGPLLSANSKRRRTLRWVLIMMCGLLLVPEVLMEFRMMRKKRQTSIITSSSSFQKIWRQSNLGRLDFAWDVNATEWTSFNTGRFNQLWKNNNYRSEGIRKIIRTMDPPKNDDGLCSGQVILNDVGSWQTWEKVPDGLEPTTPTFVVQMPTRRSDSSQCLRLIPNPFELEGTDNYVARFPPFSQRRQQVMYRGTVWGDRNMKQSPQTKLQRQQIFDMGADAANADWLNATPERTRKNVIGTYRYLLDVGGVDGTT